MIGIVVAILMAAIFKKTLFKGMSAPFVMELPPYRRPTVKGALIHMWERGFIFIKKMGSIILVLSMVIWALSSLPVGVEYASQESITGQIGTVIAPAFSPLGFGEWQASVAVIFGFLAKEVVVSTFGTIYGVGDDASQYDQGFITDIQGLFTPLSAYAFMVFVLLYIPCLAVLAAIRRETNSWKWPVFTAAYTLAVAYTVSFIVYQGGTLLGFA
jgi:ferrous iron transport protein B